MAAVLVTGATGRFGGLVDVLVARGHAVRALSREPSGSGAARVRAAGAEVVHGDLDDRASLERAMRGVEVVISSGTAHRAGPEGETRHGTNVAEAAAAAGSVHLIYVSGAGAREPTGVPVLDSKHRVEERIRALALAHTIVAPVYLMENALNPWNLPALRSGRFPLALPGQRPLLQIPVRDVVEFTARAVELRVALTGQRIALASDEITGEQAAEAVSRVTGRRYRFQRVALDGLPPGLARLFAWLDAVGESADMQWLRRAHPDVGWQRFAQWADGVAWPAADERAA